MSNAIVTKEQRAELADAVTVLRAAADSVERDSADKAGDSVAADAIRRQADRIEGLVAKWKLDVNSRPASRVTWVSR